jgi:hypothetical protein
MNWHTTDPETPRIEMMTVQLEEVKRLITHETSSHARLAFILLDNPAEVLMHRKVEGLLFHNPFYEKIVKRWEDILQHTDDPEAVRQLDEVKGKVVSKTKRAKLERTFAAKIEFLEQHAQGAEETSRLPK